MLKDIIIAALAAYAMLKCPWFAVCSIPVQMAIWLALATCLLFFCLFCEEMAEKWRKYKERVQEIRNLVAGLRKEDHQVSEYNKGNDCDTCEHQYMTGRDGTVSACRMKDFDRECEYKEIDVRICPCCGKEVARRDMDFTKDCHGIPFRLVCFLCYTELMTKGYDGEYYDERDEQIEDDY